MRLVFLCMLLVLGQQAISQTTEKHFETREQTWLGYFNQTRITKRSGVWLDVHLRLNDRFTNEVTQTILRGAYIYYLSDQTRLNLGYAYATRYGSPDVPEHRPWTQIQWIDKKKYFNLMQWFRVEYRNRRKVQDGLLADGYNSNWKFRYNFALTFPLKGNQVVAKTPFLFFNDEIHINAGKNIINNYFDQNRLFLGFGYQFTSHLNVHVGYMYIFQQEAAGNRYVNINAIRLFVFHNLDLRKQE
jgi:hypothetical protein